MTQDETLKLAARFALHLLYTYQHRMGSFGSSADFCNLGELLQAGLGHVDQHPQVPLEEIIRLAAKQVGEQYAPHAGNLEDEVRRCAIAHVRKANEYEAAGNTSRAMELRRVSNLLNGLLGGDWVTIFP